MNLASHVNQDTRCIVQNKKGLRRRLIENKIQKHTSVLRASRKVFGFNHDLIRIKRRAARSNQLYNALFVCRLDLILIGDFSFN